MNYFPSYSLISDDAQFFFEDYNFYHNATSRQQQSQPAQNQAPIVTAPESIVVQEPVVTNAGAEIGQSQPQINNEIRDYPRDSILENENNGYVVNDTHDQRERTESRASYYDDKKSKTSSKSSSKLCRVCGDKALGYNFNVVTCESCKAFFRRNALKKKKLQCPFQNRCSITVSSRRYCQKCRLRKCFEAGMKAEYIMTEEQRAQKRQRLLERESMESQGAPIVVSPKSEVYLDDAYGACESAAQTRQRCDTLVTTVSGVGDAKFTSSKSSVASSETYRFEGSPSLGMPANIQNASSSIDVAAWINEISPTQPTTSLTSPTETAVTMTNTIQAALESDDEMITIRIPKSAFLNIILNNDQRRQITITGQSVVNAAIASSRPSGCTCPCTCSYGQQKEEHPQQQPSVSYQMDFEQNYDYGLTAESQMACTSSTDGMNYAMFPAYTEEMSNNTEFINQSMAPMQESRGNEELSLLPMDNHNSDVDFDLNVLQSISNAFGVDWQFPPAFPSLMRVTSKYAKLDELLLANEEWNQFLKVCPIMGSSVADITAQDFFNMVHHSLRCIIRQHHRLSSFRNLAIEDQQGLIKARVRELFTVRTIMKFDSKRQAVNVQYPGKEYLTLELAKRIRGGVYNELKELIYSYPEKWRSDQALMLILSAVVLFNSDRASVVNKEAVQAEQHGYLELLKDYLTNTYGHEEARHAYNYLLERVNQLIPWVDNYSIRVFFELDQRTMEPMMIEILDFH